MMAVVFYGVDADSVADTPMDLLVRCRKARHRICEAAGTCVQIAATATLSGNIVC